MRSNIWRLAACLLIACLATGCMVTTSDVSSIPSQSTTSKPTAPTRVLSTTLTLAYDPTDSLHPYQAQGKINRALLPLLYQGLTAIDGELMPQPALAQTVEQTAAGVWRVTLRQAAFSDGSAVTAQDVVNSFKQAQRSAAYRAVVAPIRALTAEKDGTLTVTFAREVPQPLACLTFPIVLERNGKPLGSGTYVADTENGRLTARLPSTEAAREIGLYRVSTADGLLEALENGRISSAYTDLADGRIPQLSVSSEKVTLSHLVYLGVNTQKSVWAQAENRRMLSETIDRIALVTEAFEGYAVKAETPFLPAWKEAKSLFEDVVSEKNAQTVAISGEKSYNRKSNGQKITCELLVNAENRFRTAIAALLKEQLADVGVEVTVTALPYEEYLSRVANGAFDLYVGEIRLGADMDLYPLLGGEMSFGGLGKTASAVAYTAYVNGELSMSAFAEAFAEDCPFVPLCWRQGLFGYARNLVLTMPNAFGVYVLPESWTFS